VITRFGGPEVLELVELPTPALGPEDVLVKAHAIGVGWSDVYVRTGTYPWQHLFPMPATPGVEMSGTVAAVGSAVDRFEVGQPVCVSSGMLGMAGGCYTDARVVPQDRLIPVPPGLSLEAAANLSYYALAVAMLSECGRGQNIRYVLVSGASGGMGTALVQVAGAAGHHVVATVGQERKREHSLAMGADQVLNYRSDDLKAGIAAATAGSGVDLWFEAYAGPKLADVLESMAPWGKLVLYNAMGGHPPASFFDAWRQHMERCVSIQYFSSHVWEHDRASLMRFGLQAIELMLSGKVTPPPGTFFPMAHAAEAHRLLESGQHVGRIFLRP
jgi:NADPH2:quinone reductase